MKAEPTSANQAVSKLEAAKKVQVLINGQPVLPTNGSMTGVWYYFTGKESSQLLLLGHSNASGGKAPNYRIIADLNQGDRIVLRIPSVSMSKPSVLSCRTEQLGKTSAAVRFFQKERTDDKSPNIKSSKSSKDLVSIALAPNEVFLEIFAPNGPAAVRLTSFLRKTSDSQKGLDLDPIRRPYPTGETICSPDFRPLLEEAILDWDWRMQDGIETPVAPCSFEQALVKRIAQGDKLLTDLKENLADEQKIKEPETEWLKLKTDFAKLQKTASAQKISPYSDAFALLWKKMHLIKRKFALLNPLVTAGPILFTKHVPGLMSHQLTQVYGYEARPGGGLFILEQPGKSMKTKMFVKDQLPLGNYMHFDLSADGKKICFCYCEVKNSNLQRRLPESMMQKYQIYSINSDGSELKQLTKNGSEYFAPIFLPNGDLIMTSTMRGGYHRCGAGPCFVYTLTKMNSDGSDPHPISFHETHEWNPAVLNDGRIIYTRWDYVDRDAVYYQNLWTARQDGTDVRIFYGNNTFNPCGIWEAQPIPGSNRIMAIGGPHHGMTAGSVILLDNTRGMDGSEPVTRLTPEVLYPEGEVPLPNLPAVPVTFDFDSVPTHFWQATRPADRVTQKSEEQVRWPVHCFKSPWPFSEKYFLASYSFDKLTGEANANIPNQFGIYLCDAFGNWELLYRDPNISSVWAKPLAARSTPPAYLSALPPRDKAPKTGEFFIQNVYESWPEKLPAQAHSLRIVQVLPKTTPHSNQPKVGEANASPGKQVLGTVPIEKDGSAYFELPAEKPVLFQVLDEKGRMIQGMRSLVYLQPGEKASCTGCHENRMASVPAVTTIASRKKMPSVITPGPDGSKPFSFQILVQPVLEKHCLKCHNDQKPEGKINLQREQAGTFSKAYQSLIPYVAFSAWGLPNGNQEPITLPDRFGARASRLTKILENGHYDCKLSNDDWNRLNTWMDANALFFGTFNYEDQKKQMRGERIAGPELE